MYINGKFINHKDNLGDTVRVYLTKSRTTFSKGRQKKLMITSKTVRLTKSMDALSRGLATHQS